MLQWNINKNMSGDRFKYLFILSLLLINVTLINGFASIYPDSFIKDGKISFLSTISSNGMLLVTILGYVALIYVFIKFIDENMKK